MAKEHSILRSAIESVNEAKRLTDRFNKRDTEFTMTQDDLHSLKGAASMANQAAKNLHELTGCLECKLDKNRG